MDKAQLEFSIKVLIYYSKYFLRRLQPHCLMILVAGIANKNGTL